MNQDKSFKITITGPGISIDKELDENQLAKILPLAVSSSIQNTISQTSTDFQYPPLSIREYIDSKNPKTYPQKVVVVASYLRNILKKEKFTPEDVKIQLERAAEKITKNFLRDFKLALQAGWIAESYEVKGNYFVTSTGQSFIDNPDMILAKTTNKVSRRAKRVQKQAVNIREEIRALEITPMSEGLINYWKVPTKGDKLLWLLAVAKSKDINFLNFKELSELSLKVDDHIPEGSLTALLEKHKKEGRIHSYLNDEIRVVKILEPGLVYIKQFSDLKPEDVSSKTQSETLPD